jgi:hypothetical protein
MMNLQSARSMEQPGTKFAGVMSVQRIPIPSYPFQVVTEVSASDLCKNNPDGPELVIEAASITVRYSEP